MCGHITSVSGVCKLTCHPLNTPTHMQSAKARTGKPSYTCIRSLKGDGKSCASLDPVRVVCMLDVMMIHALHVLIQ